MGGPAATMMLAPISASTLGRARLAVARGPVGGGRAAFPRAARRVPALNQERRGAPQPVAADAAAGPAEPSGPGPRANPAPLPVARGVSGAGGKEPRLSAVDLPSQLEALVRGSSATAVEELTPPADTDYLSELLAIQASGPKAIGFFGTRNMGFLHQQLIEVLSYAMVLTGNHIYTSGATGTNAAVIRGALRAETPDLLTVVLPQSRTKQPPESQELLEKVKAVIEMPQNDALSLVEASRICNEDIVNRVQQVICFAFHDSSLLMETCRQAKSLRKMVTLFFLD